MPAERTTPFGRLSISDEVIAALAARSALACPAVAGLSRPAAGSLPLPPHRLARAATLTWSDQGLSVLLCVQVRYGTSARALADAAERVRIALAGVLDMNRIRVEFRVVGLRPRRPEILPRS